MSSTMGFTSVSDMAHELENLLDQIRTGVRTADAGTMDELLAAADALEHAVNAAATGTPAPSGVEAAAAAPNAAKRLDVDADFYARISLQEDEPMKLARAMILTRTATSQGLAERSVPEQFTDDFDGEFALVLKPDADEGALRKLLEAASEIASFRIVHVAAVPATPPVTVPAPTTAPAPKVNYVRVDQRRLDEVADSLGEIAILQGRLDQVMNADNSPLSDMVTRMTRLISELQHSILAMRMVPVADVFDRFPRMVLD